MIDYESQHRLDFGGLDFTGVEDYNGARFYAMADGATLGNATPVERSIETALLDGSFVVTESHGNREPSFQVWIVAPDSVALAYGEKLLFEQCSRRVEMGWTPPDGWGPRTVYEAFTSSLTHQFDDMLEMRLVRSYLLRVVAAPFGYSEDEVSNLAVEPAPVTPVTTTMASGTSATGWTSPAGAVTSDGARILVPTGAPISSFDNYGTTVYNYLTETTLVFSATDFTGTRYLSADVEFRSAAQFSFSSAPDIYTAYVDGVVLTTVSAISLGAGVVRLVWQCNDASATTLRIRSYFQTTTTSGTFGFKLSNVTRSNVAPSTPTATGRQSLRIVPVTGSARTAGSVAIGHATQGLGDVLLYTSPELARGYSPDMTPYLSATGSTLTTDATTISGRYITAGKVFNVDATMLPAGPFLLMFRASSDNALAAATATVTVRSMVGGVEFAEQVMPQVDIPAGLTMATYTAGVVTLPLTRFTDESVGSVQIEVDATGARLDKLWAFYLGEDADLTYVKAGAGTPTLGAAHSRVFLDAPTLNNDGAPGLFVGTQADRSDAFHPGYPAVQSWGRHLFAPPSVNLFVVTTGATNPSVTLRHRPAWHTHAGQ